MTMTTNGKTYEALGFNQEDVDILLVESATVADLEKEINELDDIYIALVEEHEEQEQRIARAMTKLELLYETLNDYSDPPYTFIRKQLHYIRLELSEDSWQI